MKGTIKVATFLMPEVEVIIRVFGSRVEGIYEKKQDGTWHSYKCPDERDIPDVPTSRDKRPDFDAVRDQRLSDLTPAQREDAHELWLREQLGWMPEYHREHYTFLLQRLDAARSTAKE